MTRTGEHAIVAAPRRRRRARSRARAAVSGRGRSASRRGRAAGAGRCDPPDIGGRLRHGAQVLAIVAVSDGAEGDCGTTPPLSMKKEVARPGPARTQGPRSSRRPQAARGARSSEWKKPGPFRRPHRGRSRRTRCPDRPAPSARAAASRPGKTHAGGPELQPTGLPRRAMSRVESPEGLEREEVRAVEPTRPAVSEPRRRS